LSCHPNEHVRIGRDTQLRSGAVIIACNEHKREYGEKSVRHNFTYPCLVQRVTLA